MIYHILNIDLQLWKLLKNGTLLNKHLLKNWTFGDSKWKFEDPEPSPCKGNEVCKVITKVNPGKSHAICHKEMGSLSSFC